MFEKIMFTVLAVLMLLMLRNLVTFSIRTQALERVGAMAKADIDAGRMDWRRHYERYDALTYNAILFSPLVWTTRQAYPWLFEDAGRDS